MPGWRRVVLDLYLAFLALLGGDEHHAAGSARTIDGGGTVLEEVDGLDIVGVDQTQVADAFRSNAVDDDKRFGGVDRRSTAQVHAPALVAGSGGRTRDVHTGHLTLKSLEGRGEIALLLESLCVDNGHGARKRFLLGGAVADDHNLVEHGRILVEHNIHGRRLGLEVLTFITDIRDGERGAHRGFQREIAVDVGCACVGSAFHSHRGADQGLALRIGHRTGDSGGVGRRCRSLGIGPLRQTHCQNCRREDSAHEGCPCRNREKSLSHK